MEVLLIAGLLVLNFVICWWDAKVAGMVWRETQVEGGWIRLVAWSAAIQSACGFTLVFATLFVLMACGLHLIGPKVLAATLDVIYLLVILPLLGTGLVITIQSYLNAYNERSVVSTGVAAWNTYAMVGDIGDAVEGIGQAYSDFVSAMDSDDRDGITLATGLTIVVLALGGGITLTYAIARSHMPKIPARSF
jgi:hypothetical protein